MANGITGPITYEDAWDVVMVLVATGRAIPARKWVDSLAAADTLAGLEQFGPM
jgi:hypothetical protein